MSISIEDAQSLHTEREAVSAALCEDKPIADGSKIIRDFRVAPRVRVCFYLIPVYLFITVSICIQSQELNISLIHVSIENNGLRSTARIFNHVLT